MRCGRDEPLMLLQIVSAGKGRRAIGEQHSNRCTRSRGGRATVEGERREQEPFEIPDERSRLDSAHLRLCALEQGELLTLFFLLLLCSVA